MYGRSIIQGNKADIFVTAAGPNPAFNIYICSVIRPFEGVHNFCSLHKTIVIISCKLSKKFKMQK